MAMSIIMTDMVNFNLIKKAIKIPLDVPTRWNSVVDMVVAYFVVERAVHVAYSKDVFQNEKGEESIEIINETERLALESVVELLQPMKDVSVFCQGSEYYVLPHIQVAVHQVSPSPSAPDCSDPR
jgi:hypothetical protein